MSSPLSQLIATRRHQSEALQKLHGHLRAALPAISFALVLGAIAFLNPRVISYFGFSLMLIYAVPILLATLAQMFAMTCNDIDLSIGTFVGFISCVVATYLNDTPVLGIIVLTGCVVLYALLGALIHLRNLPSIVVTLGMSFVWQGLAILLMPKPGGKAPDWLLAIMSWKPPFIPLPIIAACLAAAIVWYGMMQTSYGTVLRGSGGNAKAVGRAGWSILKVKIVLYAFVGLFGVFSGMALVGITRSADAHLGDGYTLLSIASVILGGGEFVGGIISPVGAVLGALTLTLASTQLLGFMRIPPDWQVGANGAILVFVLAARVLLSRKGQKS